MFDSYAAVTPCDQPATFLRSPTFKFITQTHVDRCKLSKIVILLKQGRSWCAHIPLITFSFVFLLCKLLALTVLPTLIVKSLYSVQVTSIALLVVLKTFTKRFLGFLKIYVPLIIYLDLFFQQQLIL